MPALTNPRHERFARLLVEGKSATEAYREAGYKDNRQHAGRLVTKCDVKARVAELQAKASERHEITLDSLTRMTQRAYEIGAAKGDTSGMVAAIRQLSRMHGYDVAERLNARDAFEGLDADSRKSVLDAIDQELTRREGEAGVSSEAGQA